MTSCIGPCVEHAIKRSREILGYGVTLDDVRDFALQIMAQGAWPTTHPRGEVVPIGAAQPGDLLLMASGSSGHLAVLTPTGEVEDYRAANQSVCVLPLRRVKRLVVQVWRPKP